MDMRSPRPCPSGDAAAADAAEDGALGIPVAWVKRIEFIPTVLELLQAQTGMGFTAVARVTDDHWITCAVQDRIGLGLEPGSQLDVHTTLCIEVKHGLQAVAIDHASQDPVYARHATPKMYRFESYVSVPIVLPGGEYFGNLCGLDPSPHEVSDVRTLSLFEAYASLIAAYLDLERQRDAAQLAEMQMLRRRAP